MRVLHCPTVVGGHPAGLARAERALGLESLCVAFDATAFGHCADVQLVNKKFSRFRRELQRWQLLFRAYVGFDVIHYNFGTPILRWQINGAKTQQKLSFITKIYVNTCYAIERFLLKNKIIAVTYQGDDARQSDYTLGSFKYSIAKEVNQAYYPTGSDEVKRALIKKFAGMAHLIYAVNPDLLHVLPKQATFLPYAHIDLDDWKTLEHPRSAKPIIVHAPSHAGAKGTRYILAAINQLKEEGIAFEFTLIENKENAEARKLYEQCDLLIDQLLAGWYGGVAVEAMALGKPVICYIREEDLHFIPEQMKKDLPIIQASKDTICDVLREWLTVRKADLPHQGALSRRFVEEWHQPVKIARSVISDYERFVKT